MDVKSKSKALSSARAGRIFEKEKMGREEESRTVAL